ncbi:MAG TPA: adenosylhomocysteinase [Thermoleophilaceae bacterium]
MSDPGLARAGQARVEWAESQMPVLGSIRTRFERERPLDGVRVAGCLQVTAETASVMKTLAAGGAEVALCAANPLTTQDEVAAALVEDGVPVLARHGESVDAYVEHVSALAGWGPGITLDDGADLLVHLHDRGGELLEGCVGGVEETTTGLIRLRALESDGRLACPVMAVNESRTERTFNDRYGTGQSALDGILRATNLLLAGRTLVLHGYGVTGKGIAQRARGAGAAVIVCEVDPLPALEARMDGFEVLPSLEAAERGDLFVTVTGSRAVLRKEHFQRMKDGVVLANAGHFDVEIDLEGLRELAGAPPRQILPLVEQYEVDGRRLNLLAHGRVVNLAAGEGHPAAAMDLSFANLALAVEHLLRHRDELGPGVLGVPKEIDEEIARLKLESLGVEIDVLTREQEDYLSSWGGL